MKQAPLADVCEVFNGKTPSKAEQRLSGYPVLKIKDVTENGVFRGTFESFVDNGFSEQHSAKKIKKDDILILNAAHNADYVGSKGYFATEEVEGAIATGEWLIVRANKDHVESSFVWHWIRSPSTRFQIKKLVKGIHLYPRDVARLKFPLYGPKEQKRIAAILDKADAIRRKRHQAIHLADEFLRSVFLDMFGDPVNNPKGWPKRPLGESLVDARNGLSRRAKTGDTKKDIVLRLQDIRVEGIRIEDPSRITLDGSEIGRYQMMPGDIAFIRVNGNKEYVGRSAVFSGYSEPVYYNDHIIRLRFDQDFQPQFLSRIFNSKAGKQLISRQLKTSAGQYTISQSGIENTVMFKPPIELQNKFIQLESAMYGSMQNLHLHTDAIQAMFSSLQQRAFRGDL